MTMMQSRAIARACAVTTVLALSLPAVLLAQQNAAPARPVVPVKVDVVLSRYQGDKRSSSLPFSMIVNMNEQNGWPQTSVRMGVDVPIGTVTSTSSNGNVTTTRPEYRSIGTNIDCRGNTTDDGRFKLQLSITDSSIYTPDQDTRAIMRTTDPTAFRSFSTTNNLTLKDGQTMQFSMATDKISGEVLKVEVTVAAIK